MIVYVADEEDRAGRTGSDERLVPLLDRALAGLDQGDSALRASLLGRLAGALRGGRGAPSSRQGSRRGRGAVLALAVLALVAGGALAVGRGVPARLAGAAAGAWAAVRDRVDEATTSRPAPATPRPAPASAVRPEVEILLRSSPPGAKVVRLDTGHPVGTTPVRFEVPRRAASLWVEMSLAGFQPVKLEIDLRRDTTATVAFERTRAKAARR